MTSSLQSVVQFRCACAQTQKHILFVRFPFEKLFDKVLLSVAYILDEIYAPNSPVGAKEKDLISYLTKVTQRANLYLKHFEM